MNLYNEIDAACGAVLAQLISDDVISPGVVNSRWTAPKVAAKFNVKVGTVYNHFRFTHDDAGNTFVEFK